LQRGHEGEEEGDESDGMVVLIAAGYLISMER
jgi:hypothetical protein